MSELELVLTKKFNAETIRAELSEYLKVSEPRTLFFKASSALLFSPSVVSNSLCYQQLEESSRCSRVPPIPTTNRGFDTRSKQV